MLESTSVAVGELEVIVKSGRYNSEAKSGFYTELMRPFTKAADIYYDGFNSDDLSVFKKIYSGKKYRELKRIMLDLEEIDRAIKQVRRGASALHPGIGIIDVRS